VVEYRALQLNTVMEVVAGALGGSVNKPATADRPARPRHRQPGKSSGKPDAATQFAALGLPVASVRGDGSAPAR
jgi:hypothetical protein